ncbi:MAG: acyltransferase family protein [Chitinophagaceae bacterium]
MASKAVYLPGLNGLRAIAALAVLVSHTSLGLDEFGLNNKIFGTDMNGNANGLNLAGHGVTIFFTLSGFLITFLLLKEKELGSIKVKDFYIRRILRIWPLYYLYLFICLGTILLFGLSFTGSSVPFYIFLAANVPFILGTALPLVAHYWSLGVEEQFYLFFPQIAKYPNKKLLRIAIGLIFFLLTLKFIFWIMFRKYGIEIPLIAISVTRFHTMLIGVVAAILYYYKNPLFLSLTTNRLAQIIAWGSIFLTVFNKFHIASVIDGELISIVSVILIMGQVTKKNNIINLENRVCDFIGKISYGIYIIHPLLIFYFSKLIGHFNSDAFQNYLLVYVIIISATILLAYLSYEFYEKKFLKLKAKFAVVKSSNTREASVDQYTTKDSAINLPG